MTFPGLGGQQPPPQNSAPSAPLTPGVQPGTSGQVVASRVIIIGTGGELLVYSPTAGAGNLVLSIAGTAGTDSFGNSFPAGLTVGPSTGPQIQIADNNGLGQITLTPGASGFAGGIMEGTTEGTGSAEFATAAILGPTSTNPSHDDYVVEQYNSANAGGTSTANMGWSYVNSSGVSSALGSLNGTDWVMNVNLHVGGTLFGAGGVLSVGDQVQALAGLAVTGTLTVNGSSSTSTNGLPNGTITGTSGAASAGTAHTHSPGSFSVTNGQHSHTL